MKRVVFFWLLLIALSAEVFAQDKAALLEIVRTHLLVDLSKTQDALNQLDNLVDSLDKAQFEQYVILKASYLGMVGQNRERIALVRKSLADIQSADQQVKLLYELSDAYTRLGENEQALKAMNRGIRLLPKLTDNNAKVSILQGAITLLISMDAFDDAMDYADRIYRVGVSSNDARYICLGLADRLNIQFKSGKGEAARAVLARTLQICNDSEYRFISQILRTSNAINLIDMGKYEQGVAQAEEVLQYYQQHNPTSDQVNRLKEALSRGYYQLGIYDKAFEHAKQIYRLAMDIQSPMLLQQASLTLARIRKAQGDATAAMVYFETYVEQAKRFEQEKMAKNLAYQRVKYDNLDKTNQLELLKVKNNSLQLSQKLQARNNANLMLVLALGAILLLFMTILLILSFRKKQALLFDGNVDGHHGTPLINQVGLSHMAMMDARNKGVQFSVILFEIDSLAGFETLLEEDDSNVLIAEVSRICEEQLRQSDHFGRISEHQFIICLLESSTQGAAALAERCRQAIYNIDIECNIDLPLSSTFGVAMIDDNCVDYHEALAAAEKALQEAKDRGGEQVYVHHLMEEMDEL